MNDKVKIYLDACCYIDLVQQRSGYPLASNEFNDHAWYCRRFLDAAIGNDIEVYGSTLLVTECTAIHKMNGGTKDRILTDQVKSSFRSILLAGKPVIPVQPTPKIIDRARDLTWVDGFCIGSMDAIHVATAIIHNCDIFITTDYKLISKLVSLPITMGSADKFKSYLPDKYKQDQLALKQKQK